MPGLVHRARRKDANQDDIVDAFKALGADVDIVHMVANLGYDLVVSANGRTCQVEVKDGSKPPSKRGLTDSERDKRDNGRGMWRLVETFDDVVNVVNELRGV